MLISLFKDHPEIIIKIIELEKEAHKKNLRLLYRGAQVVHLTLDNQKIPLYFLPLKGDYQDEELRLKKGMSSYSLSYSNSFLGGVFLSTDACAARYVLSDEVPYIFHALNLSEEDLIGQNLFCIPPLHPLVEMFMDGEWFHPHTKMVKRFEGERCHGWFCKISRYFSDELGYIFRMDCTPEQLAVDLLNMSKNHLEIIYANPEGYRVDVEAIDAVIEKLF